MFQFINKIKNNIFSFQHKEEQLIKDMLASIRMFEFEDQIKIDEQFITNVAQLIKDLLVLPKTNRLRYTLLVNNDNALSFRLFIILAKLYHKRERELINYIDEYNEDYINAKISKGKVKLKISEDAVYGHCAYHLSEITMVNKIFSHLFFAKRIPDFWLHFTLREPKFSEETISLIYSLMTSCEQQDEMKKALRKINITTISNRELHVLNNLFSTSENPPFIKVVIPQEKRARIAEQLFINYPIPRLAKSNFRDEFPMITMDSLTEDKDNLHLIKTIKKDIYLMEPGMSFLILMTHCMNLSEELKWHLFFTGSRNTLWKLHELTILIHSSFEEKHFWQGILLHFDHAFMDKQFLSDYLDFVINKRYRENNREWSGKGKKERRIREEVELWHDQLSLERTTDKEWEKSDISPFANEKVTITEIINSEELQKEGKALSHCVFSYLNKVSLSQKTHTIWSVKVDEERTATIEVNNNKIIQIKAKHNQELKKGEAKAAIKLWQQQNNLR